MMEGWDVRVHDICEGKIIEKLDCGGNRKCCLSSQLYLFRHKPFDFQISDTHLLTKRVAEKQFYFVFSLFECVAKSGSDVLAIYGYSRQIHVVFSRMEWVFQGTDELYHNKFKELDFKLKNKIGSRTAAPPGLSRLRNNAKSEIPMLYVNTCIWGLRFFVSNINI